MEKSAHWISQHCRKRFCQFLNGGGYYVHVVRRTLRTSRHSTSQAGSLCCFALGVGVVIIFEYDPDASVENEEPQKDSGDDKEAEETINKGKSKN